MNPPRFSIVVPVRLAMDTIADTLRQLLERADGLPAEIIVSVQKDDPSARIITSLPEHPQLRILIVAEKAGIPQLRRDGVLAAQGEYVVITEDHCAYPSAWIQRLAGPCEALDCDVTGGGVENGCSSWLGWAQYFTRYSAFLPPVSAGPTRIVPGNDACYRRTWLDQRPQALAEGFWEAEFNQEILEAGAKFVLVPDATVTQRQRRGLLGYIPLRFRHGRCYGARRYQRSTITNRRRLIARAAFIPAVLLGRLARNVLRQRGYTARFFWSAPLVLLYTLAWSTGEWTGYLLGSGSSCLETD